MSIAVAAASGQPGLYTPSMRRRVIAGTTIGNALEFFDFTVFTFLMLVIGPLFFPAASGYGQLLLTTATFGVGFLMRPVGGMLIGSYADRHGRRAAMTLTLWLMGLGCGLIALAPTYAQMGIAGPVIMVLARLIQGFAAGGEVGASTTLLVEHAPPSRRGFYSSWQFGSQSLGVMLGALVVALLTAALTPEQMKDWGWRVPFVIGILTVPVGAYIRRNLEETLEPQPAPGAARPLRPPAAAAGAGRAQGRGGQGHPAGHRRHGLRPDHRLLHAGLRQQGTGPAGHVHAVRQRGAGRHRFRGRALRRPVGRPRGTQARDFLGASRHRGRAVAVLPMAGVGAEQRAADDRDRLACDIVGAADRAGHHHAARALSQAVRTTGMSVVYGLGISVFGGFAQFFVTWLLHVTRNPMAPAWYLMVTVTLSTVVLFWIQDRTGHDIDNQEA